MQENMQAAIGTDCPKCGNEMVGRKNRDGQDFVGCSGFPDCKNAIYPDGPRPQRKVVVTGTCEECGKDMLERQSRIGKFQGCSGFPKCKNAIYPPREN